MAAGQSNQPLTPEQINSIAEKERARSSAETEAGRLSAKDWFWLLFANAVLLVLAGMAVWIILFRIREKGLPLLSLNKLLFATGIAMLLAGPILGIIRPYHYPALQRPGTLLKTYVEWGPPVITALFALGWMMAGAALRPRKSYLRGALLAAAIYIYIGFAWNILCSLLLKSMPPKSWSEI